MPVGPGRYDTIATAARTQAKARGVILIVCGGEHGDGFSAQLGLIDMLRMPAMLRSIADQLERDGPEATRMGRA